MKSNSRQQALRTRPTPQNLEKLIHLVNLLPRDIKTDQEILSTFLTKGIYDPQDLINEYKKNLEQLPIEVQDFLGPIRIDTLYNFDSRYSLLIGARDTFRKIAKGRIEEKLSLPVTQALATLSTDEEDRIIIKRTPLADALEGVESTRIRECPVCGNIYWAGRKDQPCCSKKCTQTFRVRRWRENYQEKYKPKRINKQNMKEVIEHKQSKKGK